MSEEQMPAQEPEGQPPSEQQPPAPEPAAQPTPPAGQGQTWGMLCHLAAFAGLVIPFGNVVGPLVVWLIKKDEFPFANEQGKNALNFNISVVIYAFACAVLVLLVIGFFLLIALGVFWIVMVIMASIKASSGESFTYPLAIKFLK